MAMILPLLAVAGGSTTAVMTGVSLLATVASGISEYKTGQARADMAELNSRTEELNARKEALQVNEELLLTLSRNNVAAATYGLTSSGSVKRAQERSMAKAEEELSTVRFNSETRAADLRLIGKQAVAEGTSKLAGSLFDVVGSGYKTYKKVKGV